MGQKTHPLGFRLGIIQEHRSLWYANFNQYSNLNEIDEINAISKIQINRTGSNDTIELNIETSEPAILIGESGSEIEPIIKNIKKMLTESQQLRLNIRENIHLNAFFVANVVAEQLEQRDLFRRALREAMRLAQKCNVNGIKIQVSGRLNGNEIARSEWVREGRVPLQTLRADIDYATQEANTIYGVLGIKVWLFKSEIFYK